MNGDVFRKPDYHFILCLGLGAGMQILAMILFTIPLFTVGILSPAHREYLFVALYFGSAVFGIINGFVAARFYKFFNGTNWHMIAWSSATVVPTFFILCFMLIDAIDWAYRAANVLPISTVTLVIIIWAGVNFPMVLLGSYYGFRLKTI